MIADRGWTFDDRYTGLIEHSRLPDATAVLLGSAPPLFANLFTEMDDRPGWYLDLSWEPADIGGFEIMRYDNNADPTVEKDGQIAWHTSFWEAGRPPSSPRRSSARPPISNRPMRLPATTWTNGGWLRDSMCFRPARTRRFHPY